MALHPPLPPRLNVVDGTGRLDARWTRQQKQTSDVWRQHWRRGEGGGIHRGMFTHVLRRLLLLCHTSILVSIYGTMVIFVSCFNTCVSRHAKHMQTRNVLDTWASMWTWCLSLARRRHVPRHQRTHIVPCAHAPFSNWHSECRTYVRHTHTRSTRLQPHWRQQNANTKHSVNIQ